MPNLPKRNRHVVGQLASERVQRTKIYVLRIIAFVLLLGQRSGARMDSVLIAAGRCLSLFD
jgi:hypothetical protein